MFYCHECNIIAYDALKYMHSLHKQTRIGSIGIGRNSENEKEFYKLQEYITDCTIELNDKTPSEILEIYRLIKIVIPNKRG